jgi:hypothetical protein
MTQIAAQFAFDSIISIEFPFRHVNTGAQGVFLENFDTMKLKPSVAARIRLAHLVSATTYIFHFLHFSTNHRFWREKKAI